MAPYTSTYFASNCGTDDTPLDDLISPLAPAPVAPTAPFVAAPVDTPRPRREPREPRAPRPRREHSTLGRSFLGLAIAAAAGWAIVDTVAGGRSHPEQWLGAAAVVCGAGMLVGAFRGRGRWLIIPAVLFAASGYVGGTISRLGVDGGDLITDRSTSFVPGGPTTITEKVGIGSLTVDMQNDFDGVGTADLAVGFGKITIYVPSEVTAQIDVLVEHGDLDTPGVAYSILQDRGPTDRRIVVGPDVADPDVVVTAHVVAGQVQIVQYAAFEEVESVVDGIPSEDPLLDIDTATLRTVTDGVSATSDGWFVLGYGEALIDAGDSVVSGDSYDDGTGGTSISTGYGEYRLLPRGILLTPTGEVLDLHALRTELAATAPSTTTTPTTTVAPTTTVTTTTVAPTTTGEG